jgi:predicted RNA-binding Zn-ribbon protein involved in translation (DUF1610 family)
MEALLTTAPRRDKGNDWTPIKNLRLSGGTYVTEHNTNRAPQSLLHVHVCLHCGSPFRREEVEGRVHTIGLFVCPKCGKEGPLNIEIHEADDDESQIVKTQ